MGGAGPGDAPGDLGRLAWVPNGRCEKGGPFSPPDLPIYLAGLWAAATEVPWVRALRLCAVSSSFLIPLGIFKMEVSAHS